MKSLMARGSSRILGGTSPSTDRHTWSLPSQVHINHPSRMLTQCVRQSYIILKVQYDYAHRPELYGFTSQGKQMAASQSILTGLPKASDENKASESARNRPSTTHWISTLNAAHQETTSRPVMRSARPEWSLPR